MPASSPAPFIVAGGAGWSGVRLAGLGTGSADRPLVRAYTAAATTMPTAISAAAAMM